MDLQTLQKQFAIAERLHFEDSGVGLPVACIHTPQATARVALQGAQVLAWQPTGQAPVIWTSQAAVYQPGKPVRGGVPICWPWFGPLTGKPAHGFVRARPWQVRAVTLLHDGQVRLDLGLCDTLDTRALWPHAFDLELAVTVGATLRMALTTHNTGDTPIRISQALHSYFAVGDIAQTRVQGLDGSRYLDKVQGEQERQQSGDVQCSAETDRVYFDTRADCLIHDTAQQRVIRVAKQGSASTVLWNPWSEKEKSFADMAAGEYRQMLCVETCNAGPDLIRLAAGQSHTLVAQVSVQPTSP